MLKFAATRRIVLIVRRLQCSRRYCRDVQRKHFAQRATEFASGDQGCPLVAIALKAAYRQAIETTTWLSLLKTRSDPNAIFSSFSCPSISTINQVNPLQTSYEEKR
jgi:hypothetical protein